MEYPMKSRKTYLTKIEKAFRTSKVVVLLGPRQCGKTTIVRKYFGELHSKPENYFDLENPNDLRRLEDPMLTLENLTGLIVIDEIQRSPDLFPILRVLVDRDENKSTFLLTGSASRDLIKQSSESLAGRVEYIEVTPFSLYENFTVNDIWQRGGFPLSTLAPTEEDSLMWRHNYIRTFLEQDIPALGINIPPANLRRFWMMLAHYHGQTANTSALGNSLELSHTTIKKYLDILSSTLMIRQLAPWHENISKRQVKSPKIYFRDSGLLHALLGINNNSDLKTNPKIGASWEGFALENIIRSLNIHENDAYFWAVHNSTELDLLIFKNGKRLGFEFKYSTAPKLTKSMLSAYNDLNLDSLTVIYPGEHRIRLHESIDCVNLNQYIQSPQL